MEFHLKLHPIDQAISKFSFLADKIFHFYSLFNAFQYFHFARCAKNL